MTSYLYVVTFDILPNYFIATNISWFWHWLHGKECRKFFKIFRNSKIYFIHWGFSELSPLWGHLKKFCTNLHLQQEKNLPQNFKEEKRETVKVTNCYLDKLHWRGHYFQINSTRSKILFWVIIVEYLTSYWPCLDININ